MPLWDWRKEEYSYSGGYCAGALSHSDRISGSNRRDSRQPEACYAGVATAGNNRSSCECPIFKRRGVVPDNEADAKRYLPGSAGRSSKYAALRIVRDAAAGSDILYKTWERVCSKSGVAGVRNVFDRLAEANTRNRISNDDFAEVVTDIQGDMRSAGLVEFQRRRTGRIEGTNGVGERREPIGGLIFRYPASSRFGRCGNRKTMDQLKNE